MIITIDGPAGSGKSTVACLLAQKLNFYHFNSGSLYRALAVFCKNNQISPKDLANESKLPCLTTNFLQNVQHVYVNNIDYTAHLRDNDISILCVEIGKFPNLRKIIDQCQLEFCIDHNVVIDGRDTGSFVFPNAEYKFYLDCDIDERAKRRKKEEDYKNNIIPLKEIKRQLILRDKLDKSRDIAPLTVPNNAIIIDSTHLDIAGVVAEMMKYVNKIN